MVLKGGCAGGSRRLWCHLLILPQSNTVSSSADSPRLPPLLNGSSTCKLVQHLNLPMSVACRILPLQDAGMNYTGTRIGTRFQDGYNQLDGTASFVSNAQTDQRTASSEFSNAGMHCWGIMFNNV